MGNAKITYVGKGEGDQISLSDIYVHCCDGCYNLEICSHWVLKFMAIKNGYKLITKEDNIVELFKLECDGTFQEEIENHVNAANYNRDVKCPTGLRVLRPIGYIEPSKEIQNKKNDMLNDVFLEKMFEIF